MEKNGMIDPQYTPPLEGDTGEKSASAEDLDSDVKKRLAEVFMADLKAGLKATTNSRKPT